MIREMVNIVCEREKAIDQVAKGANERKCLRRERARGDSVSAKEPV